MICYKVTSPNLDSCVITGKYARHYAPGTTVSANPTVLALGYGLTVFALYEQAKAFANTGDRIIEVTVHAKDRMPLPKREEVTTGYARLTLQVFRKLLKRTEWLCPWPQGTKMYSTLKVGRECPR